MLFLIILGMLGSFVLGIGVGMIGPNLYDENERKEAKEGIKYFVSVRGNIF